MFPDLFEFLKLCSPYLMVSLKTFISFLVHIVASSGSWNCPVMLSWKGKIELFSWKLLVTFTWVHRGIKITSLSSIVSVATSSSTDFSSTRLKCVIIIKLIKYMKRSQQNFTNIKEKMTWFPPLFPLRHLWFHLLCRRSSRSHHQFLAACTRHWQRHKNTFSKKHNSRWLPLLSMKADCNAAYDCHTENEHTIPLKFLNWNLVGFAVRTFSRNRIVAYSENMKVSVGAFHFRLMENRYWYTIHTH